MIQLMIGQLEASQYAPDTEGDQNGKFDHFQERETETKAYIH